MLRTVLAVAAITIGVSAVVAQSDPIAARKGLMKEMGAATKTGAQMAKGEIPYDQSKANSVFTTYIDVSGKMPDLFPATSKAGGETTASPKIWDDNAGFKAAFSKMSNEAKAAQSSVKDLDSFKGAFGGLTKNCGGCHETYRVKKS
jgi:cytochrome c556